MKRGTLSKEAIAAIEKGLKGIALCPSEFAAAVGFSRNTVGNWIKLGLPTVGGKIFLDQGGAWLRNLAEKEGGDL